MQGQRKVWKHQGDGATMGNADERQKCGLRLKEIIRSQEENRPLRGELSEKALDENDAEVTYYAGLPSFSLLMGVLKKTLPNSPPDPHALKT